MNLIRKTNKRINFVKEIDDILGRLHQRAGIIIPNNIIYYRIKDGYFIYNPNSKILSIKDTVKSYIIRKTTITEETFNDKFKTYFEKKYQLEINTIRKWML